MALKALQQADGLSSRHSLLVTSFSILLHEYTGTTTETDCDPGLDSLARHTLSAVGTRIANADDSLKTQPNTLGIQRRALIGLDSAWHVLVQAGTLV